MAEIVKLREQEHAKNQQHKPTSITMPVQSVYPWQRADIILSTVALNIFSLIVPLLILQLYDRIIPNQAMTTLSLMVIGVTIVMLFELILRVSRSHIMSWIGIYYEYGLSTKSFNHFLHSKMDGVNKRGIGEHVENIESASMMREFAAGQGFIALLDLPFVALFLLLMSYFAGPVVLAPIAVLGLFVISAYWSGHKLRKALEKRFDVDDRRYNFIIEVLRNHHTMKGLGMEELIMRRYERIHTQSSFVEYEVNKYSAEARDLGSLFSYIMFTAIVGTAALQVISGQMSVGVMAACIILSNRIMQPVQTAMGMWTRLQHYRIAKKRHKDMFELDQETTEGKAVARQIKGGITLENVEYKYSANGPTVIKGVNAKIEPGQVVTIYGNNGAGKTTLMMLLMGTFQPTKGKISIDNVSQGAYDFETLRRQMAYLPPQGTLFQGTVMDNMTMYQNTDPAIVQRALQVAKFLDLDRWVSRLPQGYNTRIGDHLFSMLSAGVQQRVCLARALIMQPKILILDEANTALDTQGDQEVLKIIQLLRGKTTVVYVTHRPSVQQIADVSFKLSDGVLIPIPLEKKPSDGQKSPAQKPQEGTKKMRKEYDFFKCIVPLLESLGWHGEKRRLYEASPHMQAKLDIVALRNLMSNLGFLSKEHKTTLKRSNYISAPYLFVGDEDVYIVHAHEESGVKVFNCRTEKEELLPKSKNMSGYAYSFKMEEPNPEIKQAKTWFRGVLERFRPHINKILVVAFFSTIFTLAVPLFIRSVYDWVIPSESAMTLQYLVAGMIIALIAHHGLHHVKASAMAFIGARINMFIGSEVVHQLLFMPLALVEGASVGSQVTRVKQFDAIRELFTGPLAQLFVEGPFVLLFIATLGIIGGPIAFIPLILMLVFLAIGAILLPFVRKSTKEVSSAVQAKQTFLVETASNLLTIKQLAAEKTWKDRYFQLYKNIASSQRYSENVSSYATTISQTIMKLAGIATIIWGAIRVMDGDMSVGSLLAVIILVWRALAPMQMAFMVLSRYDTILSSIDQMNRLMQLPNERRANASRAPQINGLIRFENVSFRYPNDTKPAIQGITMEARPGDVLAIIGPNGSGKSTIIKLLLGFYQAQAGAITIDGVDVRQFDPIQLRQSLAYVPQHNHFFYGTIAQNLRLSNPVATDEELRKAIDLAGLTESIKKLPDGVNTRIDDRNMKQFSSGFLQKFNLARAYCRPSKILILDEPGNTLDLEGDAILREAVQKMRGDRTIIVVTHRPSMTNLADRILSVRNGLMEVFGPKDKVIQALEKAQLERAKLAKR